MACAGTAIRHRGQYSTSDSSPSLAMVITPLQRGHFTVDAFVVGVSDAGECTTGEKRCMKRCARPAAVSGASTAPVTPAVRMACERSEISALFFGVLLLMVVSAARNWSVVVRGVWNVAKNTPRGMRNRGLVAFRHALRAFSVILPRDPSELPPCRAA